MGGAVGGSTGGAAVGGANKQPAREI